MNHYEAHENEANQPWSFIAGLLIGGLIGAVAMLILAPQSGKKTLKQIQHKSDQLREQTSDAVEDVVAQTGAKAQQISNDVRKQAKELEQRGHELLKEQMKR